MNKKMNGGLNGRLCVALCLALMLSACAAPQRCQYASAITVNLMRPNIGVSPRNRCAVPGEAIPINIRPPQQEPGTVSTLAKTDNPDNPGPGNWLNASNTQFKNLILIEVPDLAYFNSHCPGPPGTECQYAYGVQAPGKVPLDPMITVRK